jgi:hypothetical protein
MMEENLANYQVGKRSRPDMHPRTAKIPMRLVNAAPREHHSDFFICTKLLVFCNFMSNSWTTKVKWLIFF